MQWLNGQTGLTAAELLAYTGTTTFECVYSPFIRLDPLAERRTEDSSLNQ
jgi:hypothetical protein